MTTDSPLAATPAGAAPTGNLTTVLSAAHLHAGQPLTVQGRVANGQAGVPVSLEYRPARADWRVLATVLTGARGSYRVKAPLIHSGLVRVTMGGTPPMRTGTLRAVTPSAAGASPEQRVDVAANLLPGHVSLDVLGSQPAAVVGVMRPATAGREVDLQLRGPHGWATVNRTRTDAHGRYRLRYGAHGGTGSRAARLRFAGDGENAATRRRLGQLNVFRTAQASWYGGGGGLACGGSLSDGTLGVAHKTLPCGTPVTLRYRGRSVRVRVIDRGPFVAGREFDLTAATKRALGFGDTGTVWTTR